MEVQASVSLTTLSGADWLTGGSYGFESALPTVLCEVLTLSVAIVYLDGGGSDSFSSSTSRRALRRSASSRS